MNSKNLNVTILGCGAVGLFYGYHLQKAGATVTFLARSNYDDLKHHPLVIHFDDGRMESTRVTVAKDASEIDSIDILLICTKTMATDYLKQVLPSLVKKHTFVLTLQNGLGNEEFLLNYVAKENILGGVVFVCLERTTPCHVVHMGFGMIKASPFFQDNHAGLEMLKTLSAYFDVSGLRMDVIPSVQQVKWEKLVWNVPFNCLSASLKGADTQAILTCSETRELVLNLMEEVLCIAAALGLPLSKELIQQNIRKTEAMGPYRTSMCVDYLKGHSLEIESILGEPLKLAALHGCQVPYMKTLYAHLKFYNQGLISA